MKSECKQCGKVLQTPELRRNKYICPECGKYLRVPARERIRFICDKNFFEEWDEGLFTTNVLKTENYEDEIKSAQEKTGLNEAVVTGRAMVFGREIALGVMDAGFMMGSMGHVVGEKITRLFERATDNKLPVFLFCCSGGARMQEGMVSLMQMAKTSAAVARHSDAGLFYCPILTDPTTGGVTASFASLGDVIIGEPNATIGFAGKRVIRQTIGEELPEGFQTAEFVEKHGLIDGITERKRLRSIILFLIITNRRHEGYSNFSKELKGTFKAFSANRYTKFLTRSMTPWERVRNIRQMSFPTTIQYISEIFDVFVEMKGDRLYKDDRSVIGGIAMLDGQPVTVITIYRGKSASDMAKRHYGMPMPEGYRKALRLMKQAEKFGRPVITFINTLGAFCGVSAEERGQGEAIARNLMEMSKLRVPILTVITGEAGSGGALALAMGNEVWMLENATYSILTPEGYASILWRDSSRAEEAAEKMHITAQELKKLGVIDKIIPEYGGASKDTVKKISDYLKKSIIRFLKRMSKLNENEIIKERFEHYRRI